MVCLGFEPGLQDGRRKQNHGAIRCNFFVEKIPYSWCYDFPKIKKSNKVCSERDKKWQNHAIFKQNYALELLITFKMAYSCCFN